MWRSVPGSCSALLAAAAIGAGCTSQATAGAGGASAGSGGATVATTTVANGSGPSTTHAAAVTSGTQGAGGASFVCDPPAAAGSLYEKDAISYALDNVSMCQYRGDVLLIIDTAAA